MYPLFDVTKSNDHFHAIFSFPRFRISLFPVPPSISTPSRRLRRLDTPLQISATRYPPWGSPNFNHNSKPDSPQMHTTYIYAAIHGGLYSLVHVRK